MHITILGSGTCHPSPERSAACIRVIADSTVVVLDTGPGSLRQMARAGTSINDIDLLCYTHLHIDHTADFVPLLFASKYAPQPRRRGLPILASAGFRDFYGSLAHAYGDWIVPEAFSITWCDSTMPLAFGSLEITTTPVEHTPHSIGFRIRQRGGASMVYSGDTDYCPGIVELARGCDVLILECSFPDGMYSPGHLTPALAGRIAAEACCKQLVLTHFYPDCDPEQCRLEASRHCEGMVLTAHDFMDIVCKNE